MPFALKGLGYALMAILAENPHFTIFARIEVCREIRLGMPMMHL